MAPSHIASPYLYQSEHLLGLQELLQHSCQSLFVPILRQYYRICTNQSTDLLGPQELLQLPYVRKHLQRLLGYNLPGGEWVGATLSLSLKTVEGPCR